MQNKVGFLVLFFFFYSYIRLCLEVFITLAGASP